MKPPTLVPLSLAAFCIAAAAGCKGTFRNCLRLNYAADIHAEQCHRECKRGHEDVEYEYLRCLQACPGVEITQNDRCRDNDLGAGKICRVTDMDLEGSHSNTPGMGETLAGVATLAMIGLAAAGENRGSDSSSDSEGESTSASSSGSRSAGSKAASGKRSGSSGKSHKPAEASRSHTPARPTRD